MTSAISDTDLRNDAQCGRTYTCFGPIVAGVVHGWSVEFDTSMPLGSNRASLLKHKMLLRSRTIFNHLEGDLEGDWLKTCTPDEDGDNDPST